MKKRKNNIWDFWRLQTDGRKKQEKKVESELPDYYIGPFTVPLKSKTTRTIRRVMANIRWSVVLGSIGVVLTIIISCITLWDKIVPDKVYNRISWSYDYPQAAYPGSQVQRRGWSKVKEGTIKIKLLFSEGTCEVGERDGRKTLQSQMRPAARFDSEVGDIVSDGCSEAKYRYHEFKCCWED